MLPVVTHRVAWYVCLSVMSLAKMAEPIELPFGCGLGWAKGWNHALDGVRISECGGVISGERHASQLVAADALVRHWRCGRCKGWQGLANTIQPSVCGGNVAFCQLTLTTCQLCSNHSSTIDKLCSNSLCTSCMWTLSNLHALLQLQTYELDKDCEYGMGMAIRTCSPAHSSTGIHTQPQHSEHPLALTLTLLNSINPNCNNKITKTYLHLKKDTTHLHRHITVLSTAC